jgi:ABC-2 type transport system ATP-binding protein
LIKLINGLLTPDSGELAVCGEKIGPASKALVAYLPDNIYLNSWMTVKQIVAYFQDFYPDFRPFLAYEMLEKLGISPDKRLKTLSKGNKEKVCLILTMSRNAQLYVLDEPIAGVDPAARDYILSTIVSNYNPSASIIITTHLITDIEQVLDDFVFLSYGGNVLYAGSAEDTRNETGKSLDELFREVFKC